MKNWKTKLAIVGVLATLAYCSKPYEKHEDSNALQNAREVTVQESTWANILPFKGKTYHLLVDGKKAGTVTGQYITTFGNTFTLQNQDGTLVASESELKRWKSLSWNRGGEFKDANGNVTMRMGEKKVSDMLSVYHTLHFYDVNNNEIAVSKKLTKRSFGDHKIADNNKVLLYDIDKRFDLNPFADKYVVTQKVPSKISMENAILTTCIEDVIGDKN